MYKKGVLNEMKLKPSDLYWAEYLKSNKKKRGKYKFIIYKPEIHFCKFDYWGEADEYSVVQRCDQEMFYSNYPIDDIEEAELAGMKSSWKSGRLNFIKYLKTLPTKINDSKINRILNMSDNY